MELFEELQSNWVGWIENRLDGIFVVVQAPERISELNELLTSVEKWVSGQAFLAIRFHLEGRAYILQRGGFIGRADGELDSDA
jgi:acylphosphatase